MAVLVSGQGRNLAALLDACRDGRIAGRIAGVISNVPGVAALDRARAAGVPALVVPHQPHARREDFDAALAQAVETLAPDVVAMAGFMRIVGADFVRRLEGRLLNIHPSLLPLYPGLRTHERALQAGDAEHGATVHFVSPDVDGGPAIIQGRVSVRSEDSASTLAERVMREVEVKIYPQALAWMARGELSLDGGVVRWRGRPLGGPLSLDDLEVPFR